MIGSAVFSRVPKFCPNCGISLFPWNEADFSEFITGKTLSCTACLYRFQYVPEEVFECSMVNIFDDAMLADNYKEAHSRRQKIKEAVHILMDGNQTQTGGVHHVVQAEIRP